MESCVYEGRVKHRRFRPIRHEFQYRLFMMYLDLDELPAVFRTHRSFSRERPNAASFLRRDYLGDPRVPLEQAVRDRVAAATGRRPGGPIRLLTHLRYFGYIFNPVSFYYVFDAPGRSVETIVAEITNTPWKERFSYVLDAASGRGDDGMLRFEFSKQFHVSPFIDMGMWYDWRFSEPGERLHVHMKVSQAGADVFDATLGLERRALDRDQLTRALVRFPLMTLKVVSAIHWQALKLWLKGATFYTHPARCDRGGEVAGERRIESDG
jgi:hypothetical protein